MVIYIKPEVEIDTIVPILEIKNIKHIIEVRRTYKSN